MLTEAATGCVDSTFSPLFCTSASRRTLVLLCCCEGFRSDSRRTISLFVCPRQQGRKCIHSSAARCLLSIGAFRPLSLASDKLGLILFWVHRLGVALSGTCSGLNISRSDKSENSLRAPSLLLHAVVTERRRVWKRMRGT